MKRILIAASLLFLAACDPPQSAEPGASQKVETGAVTLMATAPDGTKLWAVHSMGRTIYFASTGTSASESCGKGCINERTIPTAQ
jgi:hypothetical protein